MELAGFCQRNRIAVVAYRPIAKGKVSSDLVLRQIATRHGRTPVQVALRWLLQHGMAAIPRSASPKHIEENWQALCFELDAKEMARIDALDRGDRYVDPEFAEFDGPPDPRGACALRSARPSHRTP
jgi:2,5-diketo-D-gluconate reductase B